MLITVLTIIILLILSYNRLVRQYIHEDSSNDYSMHHINGCSLYLYKDSIQYSCSNIKSMNIKRDLSSLVSHFGLKKQLKELKSFQLIISGNGVNFPFLLRYMNKSKKWPNDFRKEFSKSGRKGYLELIANIINSSGYINSFDKVFLKYGCKPTLPISEATGFMEYHSDQGYPLFYEDKELIKSGVFTRTEANKKTYPDIDMIFINCQQGSSYKHFRTPII